VNPNRLSKAADMALGLRKVRLEKGWTGAELARRAGFTPMTIYNLEAGRRKGSLTTWDRLEKILSVPMQILRKRETS
jgi:transcriptional regulator with XRE-family HTH domain